ncbi:MAG: UvrD-helicase domain-containing protein [Myxococcales bacterium]|nr:UvrD-helicase domain-containing protein [Myxococcales bacterium]
MHAFSPLAPLEPGVHLVEASAGTGKTHQIGNLFLRLVAERGLRVEEILCVTFTRAATAELRDRLRARLGVAIAALAEFRARHELLPSVAPGPSPSGPPLRAPTDPVLAALATGTVEDLTTRIDRLERAREDFDAAAISTIHAFCQGALRLFAFEAGIEIDRALVDATPVLEEIVDDWMASTLHDLEPEEVVRAKEQSGIARDDLLGLARALVAAGDPLVRPDPPDDATALRVEFCRYVQRELPRRLEARSALSFDELLRTLEARLRDPHTGPTLATALRGRYRAALVDEFQDTDAAQWKIFSAVFARTAILFLIGDPKQAIYAFRGADVHVYRLAAETADTRATMEENFRSDASYVRAVNAVFERPGVFDLDFVSYVPVRAHHPDRLSGMPALTLAWVDRRSFDAREEGEPQLDKTTAWAKLPELCAAEVVRILHSGATIEGRPVAPRDVAVLVRKNRQAKAVHRALLARGLPAILGQSGSVCQSDEARSLERFLVAMDTRGREPAVRALALTPLFGWTAAQVLEGGEGFGALVARVTSWADAMPREGFARTFLRAIEDQGAIKRLVALPDGERRVTDLRHLVELLHAASLERHLGTSGLLAWLRAQRAGDEDDPEATHVRLESDAEAVQVVTLHVSKGLQYPIVVLPYLWDAATITQPERSRLRYHDPSGHTVVDVRTGRKAGDPGLVEATREARQEALRLAYVALTRAKHATVLMTGPFKGLEGSPVAALLHGDRVRKIDRVEAIRLHADLEDLAERSEGAIAVRDLPVADRTRYRGLRGPLAPELVVRTFARERFDKRWGRVSYTALTRGPELPAEELGEDWDGADTEAAVEVVGPDVPLAAFPAGAEAGKLVHKVLENLEFRSLRERVAPQRDLEALVAHHGRIAGLGDPDAWSLLARELPTALATPLGPLGTSLAAVAETDRLDELRFDLPVAGGDAFHSEASAADGRRLLAPMLAREELGGYRAALERLDIHRLAGFLTGSIDLVLRVDGRYYVVDYKTNRLGTRKDGVLRSTVAHYGPAGMRGEMEKHHYHLQAHLYLVALHRWLATRVPGYQYERHVGGALYLFLRGMVGPATPEGHGVFFDAPAAATIEAMSRALEATP